MRRLGILVICLLWGLSASAQTQTMTFNPFGKLYIYKLTVHPSHVALLVSGDGGWEFGVVSMAKNLATQDTLVVGIDIRHYLKALEESTDSCSYPTSDFVDLARFVETNLGYPDYIRPLLVGYSSGATLVYATLVQAPPDTFSGAISLGFCPDLPLKKMMCEGNGLKWIPQQHGQGVIFLPSSGLKNPWISLQGSIDQVCEAEQTETYVKEVSNSQMILLHKVGHGYKVKQNWWPEFRSVLWTLYGDSA